MPIAIVGIVLLTAFVYGGIALLGGAPRDTEGAVSSSAKVIATASTLDTKPRPTQLTYSSPRAISPTLRGAQPAPSLVSVRSEVSPRGAASGIRRGEILPGERLDASLRRMGIAPTEIRGLVRSLVTVFDAADSHAGDTFIAQTDSAGAVLWFELRTLRGVSVGARRQDASLVAYRKERAPGLKRPATGNSAHVAARNG